MIMLDVEKIYQDMSEAEKQAYDLFVDWNLQRYAEDVLREHEERRRGDTMADYIINQNGDAGISNVHHIVVDWNGNRYNVIFGQYMNGWFCCIPDWNIGCGLSDPEDTFWNVESLGRQLKSKRAAKAIACAISDFAKSERNNKED